MMSIVPVFCPTCQLPPRPAGAVRATVRKSPCRSKPAFYCAWGRFRRCLVRAAQKKKAENAAHSACNISGDRGARCDRAERATDNRAYALGRADRLRVRRLDRRAGLITGPRRSAGRARPAAARPTAPARTGWRRSGPAMSGAEPCAACAMACSVPAFSEPPRPRLPDSSAVRSDRMSPNILVVTMTSNRSGARTTWAIMASTMLSSTEPG